MDIFLYPSNLPFFKNISTQICFIPCWRGIWLSWLNSLLPKPFLAPKPLCSSSLAHGWDNNESCMQTPGGHLGQFLLRMCRWHLRTPTPLQQHIPSSPLLWSALPPPTPSRQTPSFGKGQKFNTVFLTVVTFEKTCHCIISYCFVSEAFVLFHHRFQTPGNIKALVYGLVLPLVSRCLEQVYDETLTLVFDLLLEKPNWYSISFMLIWKAICVKTCPLNPINDGYLLTYPLWACADSWGRINDG